MLRPPLSVLLFAALSCHGQRDLVDATEGYSFDPEAVRDSPRPAHLDRAPDEVRARLAIRVQFNQRFLGSRRPDDIGLFLNEERVHRARWGDESDLPGTSHDILYYDKSVRPGHFRVAFYDYWSDPQNTAYDFILEAGRSHVLRVILKDKRILFSLRKEG